MDVSGGRTCCVEKEKQKVKRQIVWVEEASGVGDYLKKGILGIIVKWKGFLDGGAST